MTFRARPTTRTGRRSGYESDHRRNLYFTFGFGAVVVVAILLLVGAGAASWYDEHLAAVAVVNGETITKDAYRDRIAEETFRLDTLESRTREKVNAGKMSPSQGQQYLTYISQQKQQVASLAYEREIDTTLLLQLAPDRGVEVTEAEIDAQVTKDATTPESRHTYQIQVVPEMSAGATEPTPAQKDAAKKKADGLLADLKGGKTWEEVVKASGDADAAETNGDLFFIDKGTTSPDAPFVEAIFALAAPGYTEVIEGDDGTYRIGRMTEISAEVVDPNYMKRATDAGVSEKAYRRSASAFVARDDVEAQLLAEVVDKPSEQRRTVEIALEDNEGAPITPGAVLVKHLLYSPKDDPGGAAALAAGRPGLGRRRGRGDAGLRRRSRPGRRGSSTWRRAATTRHRPPRTASCPTSPRAIRRPSWTRRSPARSSPRASRPASCWRRSSRPSAGTSSSSSRPTIPSFAPRS